MPHEASQTDPRVSAIAAILEANGLGDRASLDIRKIEERATDSAGNRLLMTEAGKRRYFILLSPTLRGRLVGQDSIDDEEVRAYFKVNSIGEPTTPQ